MHIALLVEFSFCKDVVYVTSDDGAVALEQVRHLVLSKPNCIFFQSYVQPDSFVRLVDDDFVLWFRLV